MEVRTSDHYKPDVAILSLAERREVDDVVEMVRRLWTENPSLKTVIPVPPPAQAVGGRADTGPISTAR